MVLLVIKNLPVNAGDIRDTGFIPGWGRSPGGAHGNPLQSSLILLIYSSEKYWTADGYKYTIESDGSLFDCLPRNPHFLH